ncbi:DUF4139 domain-containing protein [Providencia sp.]
MTVLTRLASGLLFATLLASQHARADAENKLNKNVKLNHATVFLRGATLDNSVTLSLNQGQTEVTLTNIASNIDPRTLSINVDNSDVIIRSISVQNVAVTPTYPANIIELQEQQKDLVKHVEELNIAIKVGEEQLSLLRDQRFFGENSAQSLEQSSQKLDFIRQQMTTILQEQQKNQLAIDKLEEKLAILQTQIDEKMPSAVGQQTQIVMSVDAAKPASVQLQLSYLTPDAAWSPNYDIRSQDIESPIILTYKANLIQNTGIDWEKVNLTLSTVNPSNNIMPFNLQPWRLSVYDNNKQLGRQVRMRMPAAPVAMYEENLSIEDKKVSSGIADFVTTSNNGISLNYQIALPYTLKSTSKPNALTIKQESVNAKYKCTATPKLAEDVFLQADIDDWQSLSLLNGTANIYYANTYIGNINIDTNRLSDTLLIPFGIDKNIQISRENNEKMRKKPSFIGSTIEQKESYLIKAKNLHAKPVKLTIYDQIPISEDSDIKVSEISDKNADINKMTGEVTWDVELKPNEEIQLPFSYTLSYPKDKQILGL